jgi:hypothetical protein
MGDIATLLGRIGAGLFQQAFVVADLGAAEAAMRATLGCGDFVELPASDYDYDLRGARVSAALALAFARSGNVQVELIQPMRGQSLHTEFLASNGPGAHHLGYLVDNLDDVVVLAEQCGSPKLMGGQFGRLRFCYLDTWTTLGVYTELVEDPDGAMMSIMPWRD